MHLRVVLAHFAEHIDDLAVRVALAAHPTVHADRDLHADVGAEFAGLSVHGLIKARDGVFVVAELAQGAFQFPALHGLARGLLTVEGHAFWIHDIDRDVVGHELALHDDPGLGADDMEDTDERPGGAFNDVEDGAVGVAVAFPGSGDGDADPVAVQGSAGFRRSDEDIVFQFLDLDEKVSVAGHLGDAFVFGVMLFLVFAAAQDVGAAPFEDFVRDSAAFTSFTAVHRNV